MYLLLLYPDKSSIKVALRSISLNFGAVFFLDRSISPLYSALQGKNIKAGFAASGLFLFNPDRVLRSMQNYLAEPTISRADKVKVGPCRQDVELQTPVTPVSVEALISLQDLIIQRDAYALDKTSKQNLQRYLQKFVKAVQTSSAKVILKDNQIQFLTTINNEAKVWQATKLLVLGKAKVMSYEDLEEARAKRVVKESTQAAKGKGKRGRKRKRATPEADASEPKVKVVWISNAPESARGSVVQMSRTQVILHSPRAPVARM